MNELNLEIVEFMMYGPVLEMPPNKCRYGDFKYYDNSDCINHETLVCRAVKAALREVAEAA